MVQPARPASGAVIPADAAVCLRHDAGASRHPRQALPIALSRGRRSRVQPLTAKAPRSGA